MAPSNCPGSLLSPPLLSLLPSPLAALTSSSTSALVAGKPSGSPHCTPWPEYLKLHKEFEELSRLVAQRFP